MIPIFWSELAVEDVLNTISYLEENWSEKEIQRFLKKIDDTLLRLSKNNLRFKATEYETIFQVPIVRQITLFLK